MELFTFKKATQATQRTYKGLRADFGDGYVQAAADGINPAKSVWEITAYGTKLKMLEITAFLDRHGTWTAFEIETIMGQIRAVRCAEGYRLERIGTDVFTLHVRLEEVHHP